MKHKVYRENLSLKANLKQIDMCATPSDDVNLQIKYRGERGSLCTLKKGSLTVEAALILPFFLAILLGFFSFFGQYALAAELSMRAGAEAKRVGTVLNDTGVSEKGKITIYKTRNPEQDWNMNFLSKSPVIQKAVCRAWIGFEKLEIDETFVYITPTGSVYHLFNDCTHLKLSTETVPLREAQVSKNHNGKKYRPCSLCKKNGNRFVFITEQGDCYHFERSCSGLKRTVRYVALREVTGRGCCLRCLERGE